MLDLEAAVRVAAATLSVGVPVVMVVTTMATMPMEGTTTAVTTAAMVALLEATMATVAAEVVPLEVSLLLTALSVGMWYNQHLRRQQQFRPHCSFAYLFMCPIFI